jgi:hypothetical protein
MFRNGTAANKYSFTGYFGAGNFKLISTKGSLQLGKASATAIEVNGNAGEFRYCWILSSLTLLHELHITPYTGSTATTLQLVL